MRGYLAFYLFDSIAAAVVSATVCLLVWMIGCLCVETIMLRGAMFYLGEDG
jgi:hypothetical protein